MTQTVIALDVGGTGIKCALVGAEGDTLHQVLHAERHATGRERGSEAVVATILDIAESLAATARAKGLDPRAAGLAVPGVIDERNGVAVWAANLGFRDVPLKALLEERLGLPAALGVIDRSKLNVVGSSLAVGHPFAATGARIVATAAKLLKEKGQGRVLISICTAGGMGVAAIVER